MRKLLLVLLVFISILISLILLFNTVTNTSKQLNITPIDSLVSIPKAERRLAASLRFPTAQAFLDKQPYTKFHQWLRQQYPIIFENPNVAWQQFEGAGLVGKWIGRTPDMPPVVFLSQQAIQAPLLAALPEWKTDPFSGLLKDSLVYGPGSRNSKAVLLAQLEAWSLLLKEAELPDRSIYFVFPTDAPNSEASIAQALIQAGIQPEFVLHTGAGIYRELVPEIEQQIAFLGVGTHQRLAAKLHSANTAKELLTKLRKNLFAGTIDPSKTATKLCLDYLSPEWSFGKRLIGSNEWLLSSWQASLLAGIPALHPFLGTSIEIKQLATDSSNQQQLQVWIHGDAAKERLKTWQKAQHQQLDLHLDTVFSPLTASPLASVQDKTYTLLSNTCKEVFPKLITIPVVVPQQASINWQQQVPVPHYYFHPIIYTQKNWASSQTGINEAISWQNYQQMIQFYHQLLSNVL